MTTNTKQRTRSRRRALLAGLAALGLMTAVAVPVAARNAGEEIPSRRRSGGEMNITSSTLGGSTEGRAGVRHADAAGLDMAGRKVGVSGGAGAGDPPRPRPPQ